MVTLPNNVNTLAAASVVDPLESLYFGSEAEVVAIDTLRPRNRLTSPSTVSVIEGEELDHMLGRSLGELLADLPGVGMMQLSRAGQEVSFRGFNREYSNKVLVMLDGHPLHREYFGNTLWDAIPVGVRDLERVEIIRGPGSALYGENAFLGVVNFITRKQRPGRGDDYAVLGVDGGHPQAAAGGRLSLPGVGQEYLVSAATGHQPAFGGNNDNAFGASTDALHVSQGNRRFYVRTAGDGPLHAAIGTSRLNKRLYSLGGFNQTLQETGVGSVSYETDKLSLRAGLDRFEETAQASSFGVLTGLATPSILDERRTFAEAFVKDLNWNQSHWTLGLQYKSSRASGGFLPQAQDRQTLSALFSTDFPLGKAVATAGLRVDSNDFEERVSPRLSVVRELAAGRSVRFSMGEAFRSPTFYELGYFNQPPPIALDLSQVDLGGNPVPPGVTGADLIFTIAGNTALDSERIRSLEAGYRAQDEHSSLGVTAFVNRIDGLISPVQVEDPSCPGGFCGTNPADPSRLLFVGNATFKNTGKATSQGLELDYRRDLNESLTLLYRHSLSLTKAKGLGADVPFSPRTLSSLAMLYNMDDNASLRATVRYQGPFNSIKALNAPSKKEKHRTLVDLGLTRKLEGSENRLDVDVLNALDEEVSDSPNYESMGRIFRGSVTIYY